MISEAYAEATRVESLIFLLAACAGCAVIEAAVLRLLLHRRPMTLLTRNYRGAAIVGRAGVSFGVPLIAAVCAAAAFHPRLRFQPLHLFASVVAVVLFGLLGWLDDASQTPGARGMKGHLAQLVKHGQVTSGLVKAAGGAVVGVWAGYLLGAPGWAVVAAGALVALSANATNALDVRPGRAVKVFVVTGAFILALGAATLPVGLGPLIVLAALLGAAAAFMPADLAERAMLGDTGANALGCALGLSMVGLTAWSTWVAIAVLLFIGCLVADRWSLTAAIESTSWLRWLDELGRSHGRPER